MTLPRALQNRWWIVVASVTALLVSGGSINTFAFAVLLKPVTHDLGIGRGIMGTGLLISTFTGAVTLPIFGRIIDTGRVQVVMLPLIVLYSLSLAAFAFLTPSVAVVYTLFFFLGLLSAAQTPIGYSKIISQWFDRERGLALGIAQCGVGLGGVLIPPIVGYMIHAHGWRSAYVGLAIIMLLLACTMTVLFIREPPSVIEARRLAKLQRKADRAVLPGIPFNEAIKSWRLWALLVAFLLSSISVGGVLISSVALLGDRGYPVETALAVLSFSGLATIAGRVISGYCLDKIFAPYVAAFCFLVALGGFAMLISGAKGWVPLAAVVITGIANGAEGDMMPFFASRYFGLRSIGTIYGLLFALFAVGVGTGPMLMGRTFDKTGSYDAMLLVFCGMLAVTIVLLLSLGRYPFPAVNHKAIGVEAEPPEVILSPAT
jgi:MFS family permease